MEVKGKVIPSQLEKTLWTIRDRVRDLQKTYGTLAKWGRPIFFDLKELATVVYLNEKLGVSLDELAKLLFLDKTGLYKIVKRIKEQGIASYYDQGENKVKTVNVSVEDCISLVEKELEARATAKAVDPMSSKIMQEFMSNHVRKRAVIAGHSVYLSDDRKRRVLGVVRKIMNYMNEKGITPSNPDMWTEEQVLSTIERMVEEGVIDVDARRRYMMFLRCVPQWSKWFEGLIGAATKFVRPVERVIFYRDYLKLKQLYLEGKITEEEFLIPALHLATGAREGWSRASASRRLEDAQSSLAGLKWENVSWRGDLVEDSVTIKIYESKTNKWWYCDVAWLDIDIANLLRKHAKEKGSIIATLTGIKTIGKFREWYSALLRKISQLLGLPFTLKPHDMRRSSLSIKAELGIPLELACSDRMPLGVGWEDLKTAYVFYLRFSRTTKEMLLKTIQAAKSSLS